MSDGSTYADLHTHTTASDGALAPAELVRRVADRGIHVVSVTDHDTIDGLGDAETAAASCDIHFVAGVELSVTYQGREIHLLAYGIDPDTPSLREHLNAMQEARRDRVWKIVERLRKNGVEIQADAVKREMKDAESPGRPHVASALVRAQIVETQAQAFEEYLGRDQPGFVPKPAFASSEALDLIHRAGGVGILAHPGHWTSSRLIRALREEGLDGLESTHPSHDASLQGYYKRLAEGYGLLTTGGSDFHGWREDDDQLLGHVGMSRDEWERFREAVA